MIGAVDLAGAVGVVSGVGLGPPQAATVKRLAALRRAGTKVRRVMGIDHFLRR